MKRYKLLKDLPTFNAGDEFYLDNNNDLRLKKPDIMAYSHITLEEFPNILKDWFEEIYESKRWRAEGEEYYWSASSEIPCKYIDYRDSKDSFLYASGNYFKTEAEAEAYVEYLVARQVLLDDADGGKWKKDGSNYYTFYYHRDGHEWIYINDVNGIHTIGVIYFQDKDKLQKSLEEHEEQWEIVRKYEMGELK